MNYPAASSGVSTKDTINFIVASDGVLDPQLRNKPHWKDMSTYPHHKHENNQVYPSHRVTIVDVLDHIKENILITKRLS